MALSRITWLAGARCLRIGLLQYHGPVLRSTVLQIKQQGQPGFRCLFYKSPGTTMDALRIWKLLEFLGMDYCRIVRMRRRMKRFSYPWLTYCIPAAVILAIGDFIGQYHLKPHASDRTFKTFITEEWEAKETLLFALVGFFPILYVERLGGGVLSHVWAVDRWDVLHLFLRDVIHIAPIFVFGVLIMPEWAKRRLGFILCKWNLYLYRKLKCHGKLSFLLTKLLLDLLILSPILLSLMILAYGNVYDKNLFYESTEEIKETIKGKYWPALRESMIFNAATRPPALFGIFYLAPIHLRRLFKTVYEVIFATYVTDSIRQNVQGSAARKLPSGGSLISDSKRGVCSTKPLVEESPMSRWARYKRWACRNRED